MFQQRFQCEFGWKKAKYARITITHVCLYCINTCRVPRKMFETRPTRIGLVFKQHPRDRQMLMHEKKTMCDPYSQMLSVSFLVGYMLAVENAIYP